MATRSEDSVFRGRVETGTVLSYSNRRVFPPRSQSRRGRARAEHEKNKFFYVRVVSDQSWRKL